MSKANVGRRNLDNYRWWTKQDDGQLTELYGTHKLKDIAEIMGRSVSSVANRRVKLGLKRTPEQQAKIGNGCFKPGQKPWNTGKKGWKAGGRKRNSRRAKSLQTHGAPSAQSGSRKTAFCSARFRTLATSVKTGAPSM